MSLSYRNQSIDLRANQCTGLYMIGTSVMKELNKVFLDRVAVAISFKPYFNQQTQEDGISTIL